MVAVLAGDWGCGRGELAGVWHEHGLGGKRDGLRGVRPHRRIGRGACTGRGACRIVEGRRSLCEKRVGCLYENLVVGGHAGRVGACGIGRNGRRGRLFGNRHEVCGTRRVGAHGLGGGARGDDCFGRSAGAGIDAGGFFSTTRTKSGSSCNIGGGSGRSAGRLPPDGGGLGYGLSSGLGNRLQGVGLPARLGRVICLEPVVECHADSSCRCLR